MNDASESREIWRCGMHPKLELPLLSQGEGQLSENCADLNCVNDDNDIAFDREARQIGSGLADIGMMKPNAPCLQSLMKEDCQLREVYAPGEADPCNSEQLCLSHQSTRYTGELASKNLDSRMRL